MTTLEPGPNRLAETKTTAADAPVALSPDQPTRREPRYSEAYVGHLRDLWHEDRERLLLKYTLRVATAHHGIRMALMALEDGDIERAVRELRRVGAVSTEESQET